jgi:hypothetical protein
VIESFYAVILPLAFVRAAICIIHAIKAVFSAWQTLLFGKKGIGGYGLRFAVGYAFVPVEEKILRGIARGAKGWRVLTSHALGGVAGVAIQLILNEVVYSIVAVGALADLVGEILEHHKTFITA